MQDDRSKIPGEMQRGYQGRGRLRQNSMSSSASRPLAFARADLRTVPRTRARLDPSGKPLRTNVLSSLHPLAQSTGYVPSQRQLKERMIDLAKLNGMTEGVAEGMDDLLGAALDVSSGVDTGDRTSRIVLIPTWRSA